MGLLFLLKEGNPALNRKMIKLPTFDNLFPPLKHSRSRSRMTNAIMFSRQKDAGPRAYTI